MRRLSRLALAVLLGAPLAGQAAAQPGPGARLYDVDLVREPVAVVVKVRTSARPRYTSSLIGGPPRVIVDFADTRYAWRPDPWVVGEPPVKEIRGSQFRRGVARLVVELTERADVRVVPRPDGVHIVVPVAAAPAAAGRVGAIVKPSPTRPREAPAAAATPQIRPDPAGPGGSAPDAARPSAGPNARTGSAATPGPAAGGFRLQGIVVVDGVAVAYIEEPPAGTARAYRVGDRIGDGRVDSISVDTVVIRRPGGEIALRITSPAGAAARP